MRLDRLLMTALVAAAAFGCDQSPTSPAAPTSPAGPELSRAPALPSGDQLTPFQRSVMQAIADRQAKGLPVPASVVYEYEEASAAAPRAALAQGAASGEQERTVTARTIIQFNNAEEAGLDQWPQVVVEGELPPGAQGFVRAGDYTQFVKDQIAQQYPDGNVSYETGPRTYTFAESLTVGTATPEQGSPAMAFRMEGLATLTTARDLLMGFTVLGPNLDYSIGFDVDICVFWFFGCVAEVELVDFWAGFKLDWTIATRLPMSLSVTSPDPVLEGSTFSPATAAAGVNWDASDYNLAGVSPQDGNEFVLNFVFRVGVFLEVLYVDVVNLGVDVNLDRASSFATPLGPGAMFDLPTIDISIWGFDVDVASADVGVALTPQAGSDRYTANWLGFDQGSGSGALTYTTSGLPVALGSMTAVDGPGNAGVRMTDFRYYFNQFALDLGLYFSLYVMGYGGTWTIPITDFDLSGLMGGLYVGTHDGTPATLELLVPIENVAPSVMLSRTGAEVINGRPTFLVQAGDAQAFQGEVSDPGRDDLTLTWRWSDGSPDLSTMYQQPYQVQETQRHAFGGSCLYQVTLSASDDDLGAGQDQVPVVVSGGAPGLARLEGYWQHQLGRMGSTDFDDAQLECYLRIVAHMSTVFGELRDASSIPAARDILLLQQSGGSALEQLDRELLVVWLNFAAGAVGYDEPVDMNNDGAGDTPFSVALAELEGARADPGSRARAIRTATRILHDLSVGAAGQAGGQDRPVRR